MVAATKLGRRSQESLTKRPYTLDIMYRIMTADYVPIENDCKRNEDRFRKALHRFLEREFAKQWRIWSKEELRIALGPLLHTGLLTEVPAYRAHEHNIPSEEAPALVLVPSAKAYIDDKIEGVCRGCGLAVFLKEESEKRCRYCTTPEHKEVPDRR
jgi:hypothetical protein